MVQKNSIRVVFDNGHMDYSGGGEHVRMLIELFSEVANVFVTQMPEFYRANAFASTSVAANLHLYDGSFVPDLYILIDYHGYRKPIGKVNAQVCFYAIPKNVSGYDFALCLNDFVADSVIANWPHVIPYIIEPFFDSAAYRCDVKQKKLINIGNFFEEADGHSKNQHILLDWFINSDLPKQGWQFEFIGFVVNQAYFDRLLHEYGNYSAVKLSPNATKEHLLDALAQAKFMVHGMGVGRVKAEQTEHFGLVIVQALLSGVRPIVHASGGAQFIPGVQVYESLDQIQTYILTDTTNADSSLAHGRSFRCQTSLDQTKAFVDIVCTRLKKVELSGLINVNFGSGIERIDGYLNIDKQYACQPDIVHDLETIPWPLEDGSVQCARFNRSLEFMCPDPDTFFQFMKELYRVCAHGATIYISAPHFRSDDFVNDPAHVRPITQKILSLFSKANNITWQQSGDPSRLLALDLGVDFELFQTKVVPSARYGHLLATGEITEQEYMIALDEKYNVAKEMQYLLRACK